MKVCILSYEFPPMTGGETLYSHSIAKGISRLGNDVTVITSGLKGNIIDSEINLQYAHTVDITPFRSFFFNINAKRRLFSILNDVDILHQTYDYNAFPISKEKMRKPLVVTAHHPFRREHEIIKANLNILDYFQYLAKRRLPYLDLMQKKLCERADKIIAVSSYTAENILEENKNLADKIEIIPNGVDINRFNPDIPRDIVRKNMKISCDERVILFIGRLDFNKGIKYLIEAFSKLKIPKVKLIIVGRGPLKDQIKQLIEKLNLSKKVQLLENVTDETLPQIYRASDIFVLPSLMEGFGISILEAMASGIPCIGTTAGGAVDIISSNNGILIPPADINSLRDAMKILLTDDLMYRRFSIQCRKKAEGFSWDHVVERTINVYESLI